MSKKAVQNCKEDREKPQAKFLDPMMFCIQKKKIKMIAH